ncbi:hypothetical protein IAR55_005584 [Kwoniella newhampshirensis]|uniref:GrpB family protein n=1 Tax=Kwoniella newhampshirensis TaxID=1651941 RepID=A0AAW0YHW1_9TREE
MLDVKVTEYDPSWSVTFQQLKAELASILEKVPLIEIKHVGSTAIPGLAAKPMIDIDIIIEPRYIFKALGVLSYAGYTYNPEPWYPDRASFRWKGHQHDQGASKPTEDGQPRRMVYLLTPDSNVLHNHLKLQRVLLQDSELREAYGSVKLELSKSSHADISAYGRAKSGVIERIYAKAESMGDNGEYRP